MGYGDGSIYKKGQGFTGQFYHGGKPYHVYGATKREARAKIAEKRQALTDGRNLDGGRQSVDSFLRWWLMTVCVPTLSPVTCNNRTYSIGHVIDAIGDIQLDRLKPEHVQGMHATLQQRGVGEGAVEGAYRVLKNALRYAVRIDLLPKDPSVNIPVPAPRKEERRRLSYEEIDAFLQASRDDRWNPLWVLLAHTGIRIGEALALEWGDIDGETLHIRRAMHYDGKNRWIGTLKTAGSRRDIYLMPAAHDALERRRLEQKKERLRARAWQESGLIFTRLNGALVLQGHAGDALAGDLKRYGYLSQSPHDLRHIFASRGAELGVHPNVMRAILGHADVTTTLRIYTHIRGDQERDAMRLISEDAG